MDKNDNEQGSSPSTGEVPSGIVETNQQRLDSMGDDGGFFVGRYFLFIRSLSLFSNKSLFSLPAEVVRRVNALRNIQAEHHKIEASFFEEVHALECRYISKYQPLYEKV
jgi:hypothetical protein